ncbi:YdaU family protein [Acidovorax sp. SUPP2522]|uniref:YdaU family protein n=1 Tax=unclassified Acidovorax TaxID=2684926 RepID=UPI00234B4768|nr:MULTISPECIES: YdaU family protein [unclassified Acidovorax]WCM96248.1 YdaU family protein [Acidovorax sp. GBBC 1281]GKT19787.1 YdaU family protein [Acidovorax sp. SUPP2522]
MNYYEHHIGDYAEATQHLSILEDGVYSRLLRKYYATEKPLPVDVIAVQRLVVARSKEEKAAVEVVLQEFFDLREDGWHQARCDDEIARYMAGEPEREAKKANKENRLHRHRQERAELFEKLTSAGLHAEWNIPIKELRVRVADLTAGVSGGSNCEGRDVAPETPATPETFQVTETETAPATPATATQTPNTRHQSPDTSHHSPSSRGDTPRRRGSTSASIASIPGVDDKLMADYLIIRKSKKVGPLTETALQGIQREAEAAGLSVADALRACCEHGWAGFKATWYANAAGHGVQHRGAQPGTRVNNRTPLRHTDFDKVDYSAGLNEDGTLPA